MKNLNKFLLYRPEFTVYLDLDQAYQMLYDDTLQFLGGKVSTRYKLLHSAIGSTSIHIDAAVYIFSNLNLVLNVLFKGAPFFKHYYGYAFHDYYVTKNQFVEHYEKLK